MIHQMRIAVAITTALMLLASCGGTPINVGPETTIRACTPGQQIECACAGGAPKGVQSCRNDGSGYDQCACSTNSDSGAWGVDAGATGDAGTGDAGTTIAEGGGDGGGPDAVARTDALADAPGACSGRLESDPENCGACGHSCLGGACQAGVCAFVELATKQVVPSGLAVGDGAVFWTTEGATPDYVGNVFALSLSNPTATPTVIATSQKYPRALTFADGALYWGSYGDGAIGKWTTATGVSDVGVAPSGRLYNVVADATHVYFAMEIDRSDNMPSSGAVGRCPLDGCQGAPPEILATSDTKIVGVAIDGGAVFWSVFSSNGAIYRLTLDGASSPLALTTGQASPINIAAFGGFVYWLNAGSGTVACVSADVGATPTILASNQPSPSGIAADAQGVYWTTSTRTGQVLKLAHGTSTPLVLASAQPNPGHVRVDAHYAYWTNTGDGSIRRVPK
jgi:hypothetical protein